MGDLLITNFRNVFTDISGDSFESVCISCIAELVHHVLALLPEHIHMHLLMPISTVLIGHLVAHVHVDGVALFLGHLVAHLGVHLPVQPVLDGLADCEATQFSVSCIVLGVVVVLVLGMAVE